MPRDVPSETSPKDADELRRIAFGRTSTPEERLAATSNARTEPSRHHRTIALAWLLPIVLGSLAVGAVGGHLWAPENDRPQSIASPTPHTNTPVNAEAPVVTPGDTGAAADQLNRPATEQDNYPHLDLVEDLRHSSVRYLGGIPDTVQLWAGRNVQDGFCLLATEGPENVGAATCATPAEFTANGIGFGVNGYQVYWNGRSITISGPKA